MAKNLSDVLLGISTGVLKVTSGGTGTTSSTGSGSVVLSSNPTINGLIIGSISPTVPVAGNLRFNTTSFVFEGYNGTAWSSINGGLMPTTLDDISNQCNSITSVFNLTLNTVSLNTIVDSKDLDVFVNGIKLSPYITQQTYPWLTPYEASSGFRVRNLPSNTDASVTTGNIIIYKSPAIGSTVLLSVKYTSSSKQIQQYPFSATTIALGD